MLSMVKLEIHHFPPKPRAPRLRPIDQEFPMANLETSDFAQAVIDRMADCKDPRFKQVMTALVRHAHAFAKEVDLTPDDWMTAIQFLTETGKKCDERRQEFILLSDTLGMS